MDFFVFSVLQDENYITAGMFSVRIVTTDHYVAPPLRGLDVCYSDYRDAEVYKVPVVRVFGATPAGKYITCEKYRINLRLKLSAGAMSFCKMTL